MLIETSMHPSYLSNAYLVADEVGGKAFYVDSGAPLEPLREAAHGRMIGGRSSTLGPWSSRRTARRTTARSSM